jgi:NodT family efflux transporter outer membrane factor (OMF) lipoprotein
MKFRYKRPLLYTIIATQLSACMLGPDYVKPNVNLPTEFKEAKDWKPTEPRDNVVVGNWWEIYNDPLLNELEEQVAKANQNVIQAEANYRQAVHLILSAEAQLFPTATGTGSANRTVLAGGANQVNGGIRNLITNTVAGSWQPDLWGNVRRTIESDIASAQASAATMQQLQLSQQILLATNYFNLKMLDAEKVLLEETVASFNKTLDITKNRYAVGVAAKTDVVTALAQTEQARAQLVDLGVLRAQYEHAIAMLIGKAPQELTLEHAPLNILPPPIPQKLPSELLERRPDIAAAERKMAAANALIGAAKAAYYPNFNLALSDGVQGNGFYIKTFYTTVKNFWAIGPATGTISLFDGGAKNATYKMAIDAFDSAVAGYRQTVLTAFEQVEDQLAALRILEEEATVQKRAVDAYNEALTLTINQYQAGTVSYINVMTAQTNALNNRVTGVVLQGRRLAASVNLISALGGSWNLNMMPTSDQIGDQIKWSDYLIIPGVDQGNAENHFELPFIDETQLHVLP